MITLKKYLEEGKLMDFGYKLDNKIALKTRGMEIGDGVKVANEMIIEREWKPTKYDIVYFINNRRKQDCLDFAKMCDVELPPAWISTKPQSIEAQKEFDGIIDNMFKWFEKSAPIKTRCVVLLRDKTSAQLKVAKTSFGSRYGSYDKIMQKFIENVYDGDTYVDFKLKNLAKEFKNTAVKHGVGSGKVRAL